MQRGAARAVILPDGAAYYRSCRRGHSAARLVRQQFGQPGQAAQYRGAQQFQPGQPGGQTLH
jgi:hypothetical protein